MWLTVALCTNFWQSGMLMVWRSDSRGRLGQEPVQHHLQEPVEQIVFRPPPPPDPSMYALLFVLETESASLVCVHVACMEGLCDTIDVHAYMAFVVDECVCAYMYVKDMILV